MARKKKKDLEVVPEPVTEVEAPPAVAEEEPVLGDGGPAGRLQLTREEILTLKLAEAEGRAATYQLAYRQLQRENYIAQIDPKGLLKKTAEEISGINNSVQQHKSSYMQALEAVEKRLGISMRDCSFDETTGIVTPQG